MCAKMPQLSTQQSPLIAGGALLFVLSMYRTHCSTPILFECSGNATCSSSSSACSNKCHINSSVGIALQNLVVQCIQKDQLAIVQELPLAMFIISLVIGVCSFVVLVQYFLCSQLSHWDGRIACRHQATLCLSFRTCTMWSCSFLETVCRA